MRVLTLNGGSSSLKGSVYEVGAEAEEADPPKPVWKQDLDIAGPDTAERLLGSLGSSVQIDAVGHRIVNGGKSFTAPARITPEVKSTLKELAQFAPQHSRLELAGIEAAEKLFGAAIPQVAVFDSAFHATLPPAAYTYPGPEAWVTEGIRRFGFHGISHRYVSRRAARMLGRPVEDLNLITCHLGSGCSLAAVSAGRSIDTTMGFTPLEGLMMGTRSGSVDPGILIYLMRRHGVSADDLDRILNRESGLKGLAGSGDMRDLIARAASGDGRARLALDVFIHRLSAEMGSMLASLGGVDAIVFTGGIGENVAAVRERAAAQFEFLGVSVDAALNQLGGERDVSAANAAVRVLVVRTEEDWEIARECRKAV